jgi:hypothetical protein
VIDAGHAEEALAALQLQSSQPTFVYRYQHARPDEGPRAISSCTGRVASHRAAHHVRGR